MNVFLRLSGVKLCLIIVLISSCTSYEKRRPCRYLIPEGYIGWVRVDFGVQDAPELPIEDGYYLFKFPPTGHIKTSTHIEFGSAKDEYYYYSGEAKRLLEDTGWGNGGMIWAEANSSSYEFFFVGTEEEYKNYGLNVEKDKLNIPKAGHLKNLP